MRSRETSFLGCFIAAQEGGRLGAPQKTDFDEVAEVIRAVEVLLNTRSALSLSVCTKLSRRTVIDYGLPDFLHLSPLSREASYQLARTIRDTIAAHETRLVVEAVDVQLPRPSREVFRVVITGGIRTQRGALEKVRFPVEVQ